ncbi:MAG: TetR/AcrR family transcriptional regulator [Evtepia sp.]
MEVKKEDRRVRRTRRMLKQGLAELMEEKNFKDITVKDITDTMDLNRGTFYLHYTDTYDLLEKLENETLADFQAMIDAYVPSADQRTLTPLLQPIAEYIVENASICRSLFENQASHDFVVKFQTMIRDNGNKMIAEKYPTAVTPAMDYFFGFMTFGLIGVIRQWFSSDMSLDTKELVFVADRIITAAAEAMLK